MKGDALIRNIRRLPDASLLYMVSLLCHFFIRAVILISTNRRFIIKITVKNKNEEVKNHV